MRICLLLLILCWCFVGKANLAAELNFESAGNSLSLSTVHRSDGVIWGFDFIDKNNLVFNKRNGSMHLVNLKTGVTNEIQGVPEVAVHGQGGLLDIAVHPKSKRLYFTYAKAIDGGQTTALASAKLTDLHLADFKEIFVAKTDSDAGEHFGSRIVFLGDYLFIGIGDRGLRTEAQKLSNHHGTVIRLHLDGSIPKDNPFFNQKDAVPEIWTYGHRNPQGLAIQPNTHELWEAEFGPRGGDEINLIKPGKNYGWPVITYGREYYGPKIGTTRKAGMEQPLKYYTPSISPSGINFYSGDLIRGWKGNLFLANLSSRHLRRLVIEGTEIVQEEQLLNSLNWRIRHVRESPDGRLFISTDNGIIAAIAPTTVEPAVAVKVD